MRHSIRRRATANAVKALDDVRLDILWQRRLGVILVHYRQVIKFIPPLFQHCAHAVVENDRDLIRKSWIVRPAVWNGGSHNVAGSVLMLKAFAAECGTP